MENANESMKGYHKAINENHHVRFNVSLNCVQLMISFVPAVIPNQIY